MSKSIIGLTIRKVRVATRVEREASGVDDDRSTRVIELSDGTCVLLGSGGGTIATPWVTLLDTEALEQHMAKAEKLDWRPL